MNQKIAIYPTELDGKHFLDSLDSFSVVSNPNGVKEESQRASPLVTVAQVKQLPEEQQDAIATLILEEIEDEARWDAAFALMTYWHNLLQKQRRKIVKD